MTRPKDMITPELCQKFITLPGERLIVAKRKHWFVVVAPLTLIGLIELSLLAAAAAVFLRNSADITLFTISVLLLMSAGISLLAKTVADWYYHLYIFTTKRILEVSCAPLFSHSISDVALDQVRITEIDVRIKGLVRGLLDMGDVIIAFDRPSHDEHLVIADIKDPANTGTLLANSIKLMMQSQPVWFSPRNHQELYKFTEDVATQSTSSVMEA